MLDRSPLVISRALGCFGYVSRSTKRRRIWFALVIVALCLYPHNGIKKIGEFIPEKEYNLSREALRLGEIWLNDSSQGLAELAHTDGDMCVSIHSNLDSSSRLLSAWLDVVAGICCAELHPLEIRERTIEVLLLRSSLPARIIKQLGPSELADVATHVSPLLANNFGRWVHGKIPKGPARDEEVTPMTVWFDSSRSKIRLHGSLVDLHRRTWVVEERFHQRFSKDALYSLSDFEMVLLLRSPYVYHDYKYWHQAPELARKAWLFAGLASPAAYFKFYTVQWIAGLQTLRDDFEAHLSVAHAGEIREARDYIESLSVSASPMLVYCAGKLLRSRNTIKSIGPNTRNQLQPFPRSAWAMTSISRLASWDGVVPQPHTKIGTNDVYELLAIAIPFHEGELPKIRLFLSKWILPQNFTNNNVSVVLALNTDFSSADGRVIRKSLLKMWNELRLDGVLPLFLLSLNQPDSNHYDGAALSFYQLLGFLGDYFTAVQIMETDVSPVRSDWIEQLYFHASGSCTAWWIKGSSQICSPIENNRFDTRLDFHINGNSMYAVGCPGFNSFLRRVHAFYPPGGHLGGQCMAMGGCETMKVFEGGYDHVLYNYRREKANFHYIRHIYSKFVYSDVSLNLCENRYNTSEISRLHPSTAIVHSKFFLYSPVEQTLIDKFTYFLRRVPSMHELAYFWPKLKYSAISEHALTKILCNSLSEHIDIISGKKLTKTQHDIQEDEYYERLRCEEVKLSTSSQIKVPLYASVSNTLLGCIMPFLVQNNAVIKYASDPNTSSLFGYCSDEEIPDGNVVRICGGSIESCAESTISEENRTIWVIDSVGIQEDCVDDASTEKWKAQLKKLATKKSVVMVALDDLSFHLTTAVVGPSVFKAQSWCGEMHNDALVTSGSRTSIITPSYLPSRHEILLWWEQDKQLLPEVEAFVHEVLGLRTLPTDGNYSYVQSMEIHPTELSDAEASRHPAVVVLPTSPMLECTHIVRFYRLGVPLFLPTARIQRDWFGHTVVNSTSLRNWPGVTLYSSPTNLIEKVNSADLYDMHLSMTAHNLHTRKEIEKNWTTVFNSLNA